ncbi:MAG: hypothetical protein WKF71_04940 [Pyrinomonadaceae bacterium]
MSHLLSISFPGWKELQKQIDESLVSYECENCPTVELIVNHSVASAEVKRRVPVEGEIFDEDGVKIHFLVHVVEGYLSEIEIFRDDSGKIRQLPEISSIKVMSLDSIENSW